MQRVIVFASTLLLVGAGLLSAPGAGAQGDQVGQDQWHLTVDVTPGRGVTWDNTFENETVRQAVHGSLDLETATIDYTFVREDVQPEAGPAIPRTIVNLTVQVVALYEYTERTGNERYDLGDEIHTYNLISRTDDPQVQVKQYPKGIRGAVASYPLEDGSWLDLEIYLSARPAWLGTRLVSPTDTELNVTVRDRAQVPEGSSLALQTRVLGNGEIERGTRGLNLVSEDRTVYLRWLDHARVDGQRQPLGLTVLEQKADPQSSDGGQEGLVVLSAPSGDEVQYGLSVGEFVTPAGGLAPVVQSIKGNWALYLLGLGAGLALIGMSAYSKLKEGGRGGPFTGGG